MKHEDFRKMVRQFLTEEGPSKRPGANPDKGLTSLDAQVDRLLISYEKEAKNSQNEGKDFRSTVRRFLLEADEDKGKEDNKEDVKPAKKLGIDDINVESFSSSVVRLIDNYDNLLEVRDTLLRRSRDFLKKNYSDDVVSQFLSILREEFDVRINVDDVDKEFIFEPPPAVGAGKNPGS
jgi:hypothetical protein